MNAIVFDTEVNGLEAMEPIEVAFVPIDFDESGALKFGVTQSKRYCPVNPFEAGAVAVHMIIPKDVSDSPPSSEAVIPWCEYIIGHNVDFDALVMKQETAKRICTLSLCRHYWPMWNSHKLSSAYVELFGMTHEVIDKLKSSHSAGGDVGMCIAVLEEIVLVSGVTSMEDLYQLSEVARVPTVFTFGKHRGEAIKDVEQGYKNWLMRQPDVDSYLMKALKQ